MRVWFARFVWALVALTFLTVGGLALGGYLLPEEQQATASATVSGSPAAVWKLLNDPEQLPSWWPEVKQVQMDKAEDGRPVAWWCDEKGRRHLGWVTKAERKDQSLLRAIYDPKNGLGWSGEWAYTLAPAGKGQVLVTVTETARFPNGLQRVLAAKILKRSSKLQSHLNALQTQLAKP